MKQLLALILAILSLACNPAPPKHHTSLHIVATTGMIADITRNIIGDSSTIKVTSLMGEGVDPHLYKPTRDDILSLQNADLIFYNGLHLEGKMIEVLEKLAAKKPVHAVTKSFAKDHTHSSSHQKQPLDPHIWMDVSLWMKAVQTVAVELSALDPTNATTYQQNAHTYLARLQDLHAYAQASIATIPANQRVLITAHDAFNYFGKAYQLEVRGIQGISTESEAGVRDIEDLVTFIIQRNIPAIFVETSVSDKNVQALIEGCQAKGHPLKIGGSLYSDAMGPTGTYHGTYIGMIDHNLTTITNSLGGNALSFQKKTTLDEPLNFKIKPQPPKDTNAYKL